MEGKTDVLPNDYGGFDQGVAGVIIERAAGNIFELFVVDRFRFVDFFAHGVVGLGFWFSNARLDSS